MGDSAKTEASKTSFWKNVKTEYNKIVWPNKESLLKESVAVLCVSIVLGLIITLMDTGIQYGINFLTSL